MVSSASSALPTVVADVNSPSVPEESSLYLIGSLSFAGVSPGTASMTLTDDFLHISSWYQELEIVLLASGGISVSSVDEVVVCLELVPSADQLLREFGLDLYFLRLWWVLLRLS